MSERVLIAYGSKHGSTADTADAVAAMLREIGLEVDVSEAARVRTLDGYDGAIIAGAVYTGRWHPDARHFIKKFGDDLAALPVGVFAMGPKSNEAEELASTREQLELALRHLPDVGAYPVAVFGGVIQPAKLHFPFNRMPASDARDWTAIREFAEAYARRFERVHAGA